MRFPEFCEEWMRCTLGDITENFSRRNKEEILYPMFSVTNNKGFIPQSEQFEDREMIGEDIKAYKIIHKDDFAYNPARINVGSIAKYNEENPCMISSLYVCFKTNPKIDNDWMMQLLKTPKMNFYYNINGEGGVRIYLFYPNFARIKTSYPTLKEQQKISSFLTLLDERISTQNKIIEQLQSLIKGIVVSITTETPNTRIDKCLVCHSSTLQENHIEDFGDFPVYGANGICGYTVNADFNEPAILIVKDGSGVGNVRFVNGKYSVIGTQNILTPQNRFCLKYIFYCLQAFNFMPYKTGMAIPHIYFKDYGKTKIYCPNFEQQVKIASQIDIIESKIEIETQLLNKYEEQKKFLLSNMFI